LTIILEDISSKFDLVLEGHEVLRQEIRGVRDESNTRHEHTAFLLTALNDKIDSVESRLSARIDSVESQLGAKIDGVARDLTAHRNDTEAHGPVWRIKEGDEKP